MAEDPAGASTTANASGGNKQQVPSPASLFSAVSEKRTSNRRRCIRRPTYGIHHSPEQNLPKRRFPKSPLLGNDSCRRELNAAQSPLTMSNYAQREMIESRLDCSACWAALGASQVANKKPLPWAEGLKKLIVLADRFRSRGIWRECHPGCGCPSSGR